MTLLELFCGVDDFCQAWVKEQPKKLTERTGRRRRQTGLSESEITTLVIHFHQSGYQDFKDYYSMFKQVLLM